MIEELRAAFAGRYEIERELGAGGMATVYLARDLKHSRRVAIKVMLPEMSAFSGIARFLTEIELTANLQHPNILPLYDSGSFRMVRQGQHVECAFYVTAFIEGGSLRSRLDETHQMPVADAVELVCMVASALHYAHTHGVIHRDIKPENILLQDSVPLVADFGIALSIASPSSDRLTQVGFAMGTPAYMSPEQLLGDRALDVRSDVYALGCVLYEMLTGGPPWTGHDRHERFSTSVPPVTVARADIPRHVANAIGRSLEIDPKNRFASARDFLVALRGESSGVAVSPTVEAPRHVSGERTAAAESPKPSGRRRPIATMAVVALSVAAIIGAAVFNRDTLFSRSIREQIVPTDDMNFGEFSADPYPSLSPDGSLVAFTGRSKGSKNRLFIKRVGSSETRVLEQASDAQWPFWSPDGGTIGFFSEGKLFTVSAAGGPRAPLITVDGFGGSWSRRGDILVGTARGILLIPVNGSAPRLITTADSAQGDISHRYPTFLPDGEGFVYLAMGTQEERSGIMRASLDGSKPVRLLPDRSNPGVADGNTILFARGSSVMAQPVNDEWTQVAGPARELVSGLPAVDGGTVRYSPFSIAKGVLVYREASQTTTQLRFVHPDGTTIRTIGDTNMYFAPSLAPDGAHLAVSLRDPGTGGVSLHIYDTRDGSSVPLTTPDSKFASHPVWSADSRRLFFTSSRTGTFRVHEAIFSPGGDSIVIDRPNARSFPQSLSANGRLLVYTLEDGNGPEGDLWIRDLMTRSDRPIVAGDADESQGRLSPDDKLLAFASDVTGQWEVYVRPLNGGGLATKISRNGGLNPAWSRNGKRLYFLETSPQGLTAGSVNATLMAADISTNGEPIGAAKPLFITRLPSFILSELWAFQPTPMDDQFLVNTVVRDDPTTLRIVSGLLSR